MKKHVLILLGLLVFFSSLITSCNEEELDPNICKITIKSEGNGTVSISDYIGISVNVLIGNRVEVVATPDDGWAFIGWYIGGTESPISTDATFTFITSENVTLTARFVKLSNITIRSDGNGSVAFKDATENSIPFLPGTEVTVIATPDKDCGFIGWFIGDSEIPVSTNSEYTFTSSEDITLIAKFSKYPMVVLYSTAGGNVSIKNYSKKTIAVPPSTEVTIIATANKNCNFTGWYTNDTNILISLDSEYTIAVTNDIILNAKFITPVGEAIDLGLSVKWASFNVGAYSPEDNGGYYAWGETEEKNNYDWSTYKWCEGSYNTMTKYCTDNSWGTVDNKTILELEDDVAHTKWGGNWRMPTLDELMELSNNCTWTRTLKNFVWCYEVTGPNGNSIFLPIAGYRTGTAVYGDSASSSGTGSLWSGSLACDNKACYLYYYFGDVHDSAYSIRYMGRSVRPVCE